MSRRFGRPTQPVPHVYLVDNSRMLPDIGHEIAPGFQSTSTTRHAADLPPPDVVL